MTRGACGGQQQSRVTRATHTHAHAHARRVITSGVTCHAWCNTVINFTQTPVTGLAPDRASATENDCTVCPTLFGGQIGGTLY